MDTSCHEFASPVFDCAQTWPLLSNAQTSKNPASIWTKEADPGFICTQLCALCNGRYTSSVVGITTVRVLNGAMAGIPYVCRPLMHERGCERLEVFIDRKSTRL